MTIYARYAKHALVITYQQYLLYSVGLGDTPELVWDFWRVKSILCGMYKQIEYLCIKKALLLTEKLIKLQMAGKQWRN